MVAVLETALVTNLLGLVLVAVMTSYVYDCASVEEKNPHRNLTERRSRLPERERRCSSTSSSCGRG